MKKKTILIIGIIIAVLLASAIGSLVYLRNTYVIVGGESFPRNATALKATVTSDADVQAITELTQLQQLDLRTSDLSPAQFDTLKAALPECNILWNVPLQSGAVASDTAKLNLTSLSDADIPLIAYFPELTKVNARGCTDYEQLLILAETYPQLDLYYTLSFDGQFWPNSTTGLTVGAVTLEELGNVLKYLPNVATVTLNTAPEDPDAMMEFQQAHPDIECSWLVDICGVLVESAASEINLSGIPMANTEELESKLKYLPNLTKVDMCGCGISNEEMEALNNRHEGIQFVWTVQVDTLTVRTDVTEFMPVKYDVWVGTGDVYNLRYLTELIALDLGHMEIDNCEFVRYMPHLKYLILADTDVTDFSPLEGLDELIFLEVFMCPIRDYSPFLTLTAMEDLNICYTYGDPEIIGQMTWLKRLWWGQVQSSRISDAQRQALCEKLPDTEIEYEPHSSTGAGWRMGQNYYDMRDIFGMGYMTH